MLERLPPDILRTIITFISAEDHLATKLTSKTISAYSKAETGLSLIDTSKLTKSQQIACHTCLEADLPRPKQGRATIPTMLICTVCGKLQRNADFADAQFNRTNPNRICIACGIKTNKYTSQAFKVCRKPCFPCRECKKAVHLSQEYLGLNPATVAYMKEYWHAVPDYKAVLWCRPCARNIAVTVRQKSFGPGYLDFMPEGFLRDYVCSEFNLGLSPRRWRELNEHGDPFQGHVPMWED